MILVAEDNKVNQKVIRVVLDMGNYEAEIVANGALAVERFSSLKPALVLMDIAMPVMSGIDAAKAIRKLEEGSSCRTPIIAVTADVVEGEKELCFQAGMDDFVSKPIFPQDLLDLISSWLGGSKNSSAS